MQVSADMKTTSVDLQHAPLLARLAAATGRYSGQGVNHLDESFRGEMEIRTKLDGQLVEISFRATDADQAFHEEATWITEDLMGGGLGLWTVSSNTPGVLQHRLQEDAQDGSYSTKAVFRLGDPADLSRFRQEISLCIRHDGGIEYAYSWGVPHEAFGSRSRCLLQRLRSTSAN
jgi:hypothetical protein